MSVTIKKAEFIVGAASLEDFPNFSTPEVAFFGRSNVGKSTLINTLTVRRDLAHASRTPGRTQQINLFKIVLDADGKTRELILADLPGYGFAKLSKEERERLAKLSIDYLNARENLNVVVILNDSKRLPTPDDIAIRDMAFEANRHALIALTKCDRLKRNELQRLKNDIAKCYGLHASDLIETGTESDPTEVWQRILTVLPRGPRG